jgi:hypothetical protein
MKLYWFRNLVHYFPSWDTPIHEIWRDKYFDSLKNDVKGTQIYLIQLDGVLKKKIDG